ncbi:MAG: DMT family transporter [Candidatus Nanopelagicales bacterium]
MAARALGWGSFLVILVLSGFMNALQARANGELARHLGNGVQAALVSFATGLLLLTLAVLAAPSLRVALRRIVPAVRSGALPWWAVPAGLLGGLFIASQSFSVALVGVALFSVGMVAGQTSSSLLVDRAGLGPIGVTAITGNRLLSAVLATGAVLLAVSGRLLAADVSVLALVAAFVAGCLVAVQQALNGRVNTATRQPIATTWLNFAFGTAGLLVGSAVGVAFLGASVRVPAAGPWWMYLGGVFGMVFIVTASWAVPRFGVLVFALVTIAGQLSAALALDAVAPVAGNRIEWTLVAGVLVAFVAVSISARRRP